MLQVDSSVTATLSGLKITGGNGVAFGGGIYNSGGLLTVDQSEIDGNAAQEGGGIFSSGGKLTLTNSTVAFNSVTDNGGGVYVSSSSSIIANSTIAQNAASNSGGGIYDGRSASILNSTIVANHAQVSGGISSVSDPSIGSGTKLTSSIVAQNTTTTGSTPDIGGSTNSFNPASSYNLIGYDSDLTNGINDDPNGVGNHNRVGGQSGAGAFDPRLGTLGDNGGPTKTMALLPGSPAIDAGDPAAAAGVGVIPPFDQRGSVFDTTMGFDRVSDGDENGSRAHRYWRV